jgi:GNAT superfamily N-acetyltransferase
MGTTVHLPNGTSPSLALVHPTEEEKLLQFKLNGAEWRGALGLEAYLRREAVLSSQALTRDGGITYWILVDTANRNALDPDSNIRLPLASCETYRKKALVWRDGKLQETVAHGIGSVFCAPHLRKKGYAARMMRELGRALQTYQTGDKECLFSVLFSDIGKSFYAEHGWEPFNSSHISIPGIPSDVQGLPDARPLYADDLKDLCAVDERLIRRSLESRTRGSNIAVALVPDIETIRWHHAREEFVGNELHGKTPKIKGAIVGSEIGKRIWCYWTRMYYNPHEAKGNTLHILRLVVEDEQQRDIADAFAALISMAQEEAQEWKMAEVEAWNPSAATVAAAQKLHPAAKVIDRDSESIASLRWYPEHEGKVADSIDWVGNEKFGWC